ncbi:MAG: M23 family metallopeptidase [Desulfuromonadales bacterium]|nr:M23 family metallopeptidase [Desulfuromonadales bacterium]MBN2791157.1 M23 family metallopeptidase [Desulfuromonadales bacterium]
MAKRFSLIIIPDSDRQVRRVQVRSGWLTAGFCCAVVLFGLSAFFTYSYFTQQLDQAELLRLRAENSRQRQDLQRLVLDLENVQFELNSLAETDARVRQLASLDSEPQGLPVAIGGLPEEAEGSIDEIQRQINQLQVEIELRRQSQEDVRNLLNDQVSISRATPEGWPTKGWITSYFGMRKSPFTGRRVMHEGLDIAANTGTPVYATADGIVARVEYSKSYGKTVVVDHGYGYRTIFGHNSKILVKSGQRVKRGDRLALVGNTGQSTGPHLHYELRMNGVPIDPRKTL